MLGLLSPLVLTLAPVLATPQLTLTGTCPGPGTLAVTGATPNGVVGIAWSHQQGSALVPVGPCIGTQTMLQQPHALLFLFPNANGNAQQSVNMPPAVCGNVVVQGLDLPSCTTTNLVAP